MIKTAAALPTMAACPQLPFELKREPQKGQAHRHQPSSAIDILTISDNPTLCVYLSGLFRRSGWTIARARTCEESVSFLKENRAAVAVCEETLPDGFWRDTAGALVSMPDAPALIVIGDDESLVGEVSALGGFDALVRPFRDSDAVWTIASAWHAWMNRFERTKRGAP